MTEPQQPSNSLPHQPTPLTPPAYNVSARTAQKTPFLSCYAFVACAAIGVDRAKNAIPLLPFAGHYLATGVNATIWTNAEVAKVVIEVVCLIVI
jgi:hypothetical protein